MKSSCISISASNSASREAPRPIKKKGSIIVSRRNPDCSLIIFRVWSRRARFFGDDFMITKVVQAPFTWRQYEVGCRIIFGPRNCSLRSTLKTYTQSCRTVIVFEILLFRKEWSFCAILSFSANFRSPALIDLQGYSLRARIAYLSQADQSSAFSIYDM